jgi:hypothetical protein
MIGVHAGLVLLAGFAARRTEGLDAGAVQKTWPGWTTSSTQGWISGSPLPGRCRRSRRSVAFST